MSERVAIVVGAGGELGRATAETLRGAGFSVVGVVGFSVDVKNAEARGAIPEELVLP